MTNQKGFTLLEVMVAMGICAVAGIAALQATGAHINNMSIIEQQTYASWVAENQMVMARTKASGGKWNGKNSDSGDAELAGHKWYWSQKVEKTADAEFVKLTIEVFEDENRENSVYDLTTFMYKGKK
ncbi:type II secretion system minor pseudopilin GspI [Pseudoalteromonas luteoviolacea]|uniref:type II secretion system minor pseudopilin GspI n=1 Tax=Pseudoalteromonas luteoviolacea TaxID=43657 RepID=UPI001EEEC4ED|nr:type II secretion system minor pseudopilin GspI [Pseudoalteromonas luteoviolacea]MCF6438372.1 type II secretion system minor pseudopilin GspI [Pseudoalteromonas luteoviolacea]